MEIRKMVKDMAGEGGGAGATLVYNSGALDSVSTEIGKQKEQLVTKIGELFDLIDKGFAEIWTGNTYQSFKNHCDTYRTNSIEPMIAELEDFGAKVQQIADTTRTASAEVSGIFDA